MDLFEHVGAFILVCRALGLDTRLVLNLDVVPLKPPSDDKKSTSNAKVIKARRIDMTFKFVCYMYNTKGA
jgi:hypothetical protein